MHPIAGRRLGRLAAVLAAVSIARQAPAGLGDIRVNTSTTGDQSAPAIAADLSGAFTVIWVDVADGSVTSIAGRRFSSNGLLSPLGAEFRVNTTTAGGQYAPSVGRDSTGAFVVVWYAFQDGNGRSVHGQRFDSAGAPAGGEFRVNTYTTGSQTDPVVAVSPAGSFAVVWASATTSDPSGGVFLQRYDAAGAPQGGETRVNTATTGLQQQPWAAMTSTGDFVVVWSSLAAGAGIRGQRYSAAGSPIGSEFAVGGATGVSARPRLATDLSGGFVVVWENSPDFADDVFMRRFSSTGAPLTGEIRVNTYTSGLQEAAAVTVFPSGDFVIAWHGGFSEDGAGYGVFAQRYAPSGAPVGGEILVNAHTDNDQTVPALAPGAGGGFLAVWQSHGQDSAFTNGIFGRQEFVGSPVDSSDFRVNTFTTQDQLQGRIGMDASGSYVVVWSSRFEDGQGTGVFAQLFDDSDAPIGAEFRVNQATLGYQDAPDVAVQPTGGFVVTWETILSGSADVLMRRYDDSALPLGNEVRVNAATTGIQTAPRIAASDSGFVVVWRDTGTSGYSIFAQRFDPSGAPVAGEFRVDSTSSGQVDRPSLGMAADASFVVVWDRDTQTAASGFDVFGQRFSADGSRRGSEFRVNAVTTTNQFNPEVSVGPGGDFVVVWQGYDPPSAGDVFARRFAASGAPIGGEFRVNTYTSYFQGQPVVAKGRGGEFVVSWLSLGETGPGGAALLAQRYGRDGQPLQPPFRVNASSAPSLAASSAAFDPRSRPVVVFDSYGTDGSRYGVFRRRFPPLLSGDADGNGVVDVADVFYLVNFLFAGGPAPLGETDVNADGSVTVVDVFALINFLFAGGPPPV